MDKSGGKNFEKIWEGFWRCFEVIFLRCLRNSFLNVLYEEFSVFLEYGDIWFCLVYFVGCGWEDLE